MKGSALELAEAEGFGPSPSHFQLSTSNSCSSGLYTADPLAPPHTDPRTAWIYTFSVSLAPGNAQVTPLSDTDCIFCYANDVSLLLDITFLSVILVGSFLSPPQLPGMSLVF